jgi:DNA-binding GntR family transcriptional regulator
MLLELGCLLRVIDRSTEQASAEMKRLLDALDEEARRESDPGKIIRLDLSFHESMCRVADHGRLYIA